MKIKNYVKIGIIGGTLLSSGLLNNNTFAGHGLAMPGALKIGGYLGVLQNGSNNIIFATGRDKGYDILLRSNDLNNDFGLEAISNFTRGEKKFIGHAGVNLASPQEYHYSNYNYADGTPKPQEGSGGRTWVYGVWEANGGKYNLYDAAGGKWGDCVPYYISGSNRMNRIHNGNSSDPSSSYHYLQSDGFTKNHTKIIKENTTLSNVNSEVLKFNANSKQFFTPNYLGKYAYEELGMQMYIPYVVNDQGQRQSKINLISNAGHLNGDLNPDQVDFTFSFY